MNTKRPDFSNVQGGTSSVPGRPDFSDVQGGSSAVHGGGSIGSQRYTVESGDTLSHIAKQFYGKANRWQAIFEANRDQLDDPDLIRPGQVLVIPALADDHD